ncbi:MAG: multicopper oxidase family protein [Terriglobia bacterium]
MNDRRRFFRNALSFGLGAGLISASSAEARQKKAPGAKGAQPQSPGGRSGKVPVPVQTPDLEDLPYSVDNGVKVFHLITEPVKQQLVPGKTVDLWGYNGSSPGPTIQVNRGDRVRIIVDNHLPEPTSMHWHGFEIPVNMDGVPGLTNAPINPGGRFVYEFTLHQEGTYFYHSHMAMQEMLGMLGAFIMHPKEAYTPAVDKDFVIMLQEYAVLPNNSVPNTMNMDFNWLTMNGKSGPAITPMIVRLGDRVRIRLINLGMDHHPIHLHGNTFWVTGTEGGRIPKTAWIPGNTVLDGVAQARDIEFDAKYPGDWLFHCHLPHHMMNQMSSNAGPMSRLGTGVPAGVSMENGMGMLTGEPGVPMGDDYGPSLGRGLGFSSTSDTTFSNTPFSPQKAKAAMRGMQHGGMSMKGEIAPDANSVPGFPQDAYMEGPMMVNKEIEARPYNFGMRPGWSGFLQGMMTVVRVLPPDEYGRVMEQIQQGEPVMPSMKHPMQGRGE